ncbi:sensor histidine kinase [Haloactinospora alba]|nr:sensor histidine kinase [Haloactinospora alba]
MVASAYNHSLLHWLEFSENRPPRILSVFFWGTMALTALMVTATAITSGTQEWAGNGKLLGIAVTGAASVCALWLVIPWSPAVAPRRKILSVLFLVGTVISMMLGNFTVFVLMSLAIGNTLIVFGTPAAIGYIAVVVLFHSAASLANPKQSLTDTVFNASMALFQCAAVVLVFLALFEASRSTRETRRLYSELETANIQLRRYADRVQELTVAEERTRIAREMHDSIGHHLTVINMGLENARRFRATRPEDAWEEVTQAQRLTREALEDTRRWVRALRPLRLEGRAGSEAIRELAESLSGEETRVTFTMRGTWPRLDDEVEAACYRVAQEGVTNALRHSGAGLIRVRVEGGAEVTVDVSDDGAGADPKTLHHGLGLRGLRERVASLGGSLEATPSGPSGGVVLRAVLPARGRNHEDGLAHRNVREEERG